MNEEKLKKRGYCFTAVLILIGLIVAVCAVIMLRTIWNTDQNSYDAYITDMMNEYKLRFQEQIYADEEALLMVSRLLADDAVWKRNFDKDFSYDLPENSQFLELQYYDMKTVAAMKADGYRDRIPPEAVKAVQKALSGEGYVSEVYPRDGHWIVTYAVPVYRGTELLGILTASKDEEVFFEILREETLTGLQMDILWLRQNGEIIPTGHHDDVPREQTDIYELGEISEAEQKKITEQLNREKACLSSIKMGNNRYKLYLTPLEINGWFLAYVDDSGSSIKSPVYDTVLMAGGVFALVILLSVIGMIYTYRFMRENNRQMIDLSDYDLLTGIYNFRRFMQEIQEFSKKKECFYAVALNLRHFAYITEIFGRKEADKLLVEIAAVLQWNLKPPEFCCRSMADQYYIILCEKDSVKVEKRLETIVEQVRLLSRQFQMNVTVSMYCGVAEYEETDRLDTVQFLHRAEFAMESIHGLTEERIAFYNQDMHETENFQRYIESNMREALKNQEFQLYLQPKKDLKTGEISGAEALVRWVRPDGTVIMPNRFIPLFEQNGFCGELDLYMIEKLCQKEQEWREKGLTCIPVSVNQSKLLFYREDYVRTLCEITDRYQVPRELVILEILEGLAAEEPEVLNQTIRQLKKAGFRVSLDDFGSGYSTLNSLSGIEVDEVKLDRGFLLNMDSAHAKKQRALMRSIVRITKDFQIHTVVEGVETWENEAFIQSIGCDYGQGYLYSKPIPAEEFEQQFLKKVR